MHELYAVIPFVHSYSISGAACGRTLSFKIRFVVVVVIVVVVVVVVVVVIVFYFFPGLLSELPVYVYYFNNY